MRTPEKVARKIFEALDLTAMGENESDVARIVARDRREQAALVLDTVNVQVAIWKALRATGPAVAKAEQWLKSMEQTEPGMTP